MIDVNPNHLETVTRILAGHVPECEVRAFGSRVTWTAKDYSDLDLAVVGEHALDADALRRLKEAFEESDLPFRVDVLDWHAISAAFRGVIEKKYEVVQKGKKKSLGKAGEWSRLSLREAGVTLIDCDHRTPPASEGGYPYVAIPQLRNGRIDLSDVRRIAPERFVEWTRKAKPAGNDVVLSRRCNPGETAFVPPNLEFALGQNLVLLRADGKKVHPPFLRWLVRGPEWWEQIGKFLNVGAVFDSLRCADVPNFQLSVPPLPEQRAIAHILGTLDDKIELNRRMNETLEAVARALFKSWFVDFDPVRAKAGLPSPSGRGAGGEGAGIPKPLADLFPDSFEDSELGEIPRGWRVQRVRDIGPIVCGKTPPTQVSEYYGHDVPFIMIPDMHGRIFATSVQKRLSHAGAQSQEKKLLPADTICVSCIATAGLVVITSELSQTNQQINSVVPNQRDATYFWYWTLRNLGDQIRAGGSGGSVLTNLSTGRFGELRVLASLAELRSCYHAIAAPAFGRILENEHESRSLAALRDALLPKLISGELRVKDVARQVAEAAA